MDGVQKLAARELAQQLSQAAAWHPRMFAGVGPRVVTYAVELWARQQRADAPDWITGRELQEALESMTVGFPPPLRRLLRWAVVVRAGIGRISAIARRWVLSPALAYLPMDAPAVPARKARWAVLQAVPPRKGAFPDVWLRLYELSTDDRGELAVRAENNILCKNVWRHPVTPQERSAGNVKAEGLRLDAEAGTPFDLALRMVAAARDADEALRVRRLLGELAGMVTAGDLQALLDKPELAGPAQGRVVALCDAASALADTFQETEPQLPRPIIGWPEGLVPDALRSYVRPLSGTVLQAVPLRAAYLVDAPRSAGLQFFDYTEVLRSTCRWYYQGRKVLQCRPSADGQCEITVRTIGGTETLHVPAASVHWVPRAQVIRPAGRFVSPEDMRIAGADFAAVNPHFRPAQPGRAEQAAPEVS